MSSAALTIVPAYGPNRLPWNAGAASFRCLRQNSPSAVTSPFPSSGLHSRAKMLDKMSGFANQHFFDQCRIRDQQDAIAKNSKGDDIAILAAQSAYRTPADWPGIQTSDR